MHTHIPHTKDNTGMETLLGKMMLALTWILAVATGQWGLWILSAIPSILASIVWYIKLRKELRDDETDRNIK